MFRRQLSNVLFKGRPKHPMEQPLLEQTNDGYVQFHCQWKLRLQTALRLPTTQYWHGDTILDCANGSSQSKRSLKIGGWMERRSGWWDMSRIAWLKNTTSLDTDNCLIILGWLGKGSKWKYNNERESLAEAKGTPQECCEDHFSRLPA